MYERYLEVNNLVMYYRVLKGEVRAVDDVSFFLGKGEVVAIIGESGCGKSSLAKALIRVLPRNVSVYTGAVLLDGLDLMKVNERAFDKEVRWVRITYIPQAALNSLNPVLKVGDQMVEPLVIRNRVSKNEALETAMETLEKLGISRDFLQRYPFELSGGMKQRIIIAMSLMVNPEIMILDEPTSSLDVLTQASIMNLLKKIKEDLRLSMLFVTHDLSLSSELADRVTVMYAGQVVEFAKAENFYPNPRHPYSQKLMESVPTLRIDKNVSFIPGSPPSLLNPPHGCRFRERCPFRFDKCTMDPPLLSTDEDSYVRCWLYAGR
ncbi:MAG: ABC transporter ATP-binding protein [Thermoproteota archaeon]